MDLSIRTLVPVMWDQQAARQKIVILPVRLPLASCARLASMPGESPNHVALARQIRQLVDEMQNLHIELAQTGALHDT